MKNSVTIERFCASNDSRSYLNEPFQVGDLIAASNGHVLIFHPGSGAKENNNKASMGGVNTLLKTIDETTTKKAPHIKKGDQIDCAECGGRGTGSVGQCSLCDGDGDCPHCGTTCPDCDGDGQVFDASMDGICSDCNGDGKVYPKWDFVQVSGVYINPNYWALISNLPDLKTAKASGQLMLVFKSGEYKGAIMGVRK
jgi:DnaJ-class molecular chaperone